MSHDDHSNDPGQAGPSDPALGELHARLAELQQSVERLGTQPQEPQPQYQEPQPYAQPQGYPEQAYAQPEQYAAPAPPPPAAYQQVPAPEPIAGSEEGYYSQPPQEPQYFQHEEESHPPAATNGHGEDDETISAVSASIFQLNVGPFIDLIELRHFEEAVVRLETVRDVRVRRFGLGRAQIEIGMAGPYAISRELYRLGRPIHIEQAGDGTLHVDFTDTVDPFSDDAVEEDRPAHEVAAEGDDPEGDED